MYLLVGLIGTPIITRLVDPVDYGSMSMLTVYSSIGLMLCGLGLDQTLVRYFYRSEDIQYQRKILYTCFALPMGAAAVLGVVLVVFSVLSSRYGMEGLPMVEAVLLEVNVIALLLQRFSQLILRLRYHTKTYSAVNLIQKSAYIVLTVVLVLLIQDHYFIILALATILSTLLSALIAIICEREIWKLPERGTTQSVRYRELLQYGLPLMLSSGITMIFNALDRFFINHYCTLADVGVYASAMNLMNVFSIVRTSFNALWMPMAIEHYEKNPGDKTFYQQGNTFVSMVMLAFGAALILCKDLFVLLLGSKYQAASMILPYLMFEPIMYTVSETTATGIVVQKKSTYQVIVALGACVVNFFGNWLLTPIMGPQGAALSTGVSYIVFFALRTLLANRAYYVDYKLSRFVVSSAALFLFAIYGSNHTFSWLQVWMFLAVASVIALAYRKDLAFGIRYGVKLVKKILKK